MFFSNILCIINKGKYCAVIHNAGVVMIQSMFRLKLVMLVYTGYFVIAWSNFKWMEKSARFSDNKLSRHFCCRYSFLQTKLFFFLYKF